jgi:hypothetical protein
VVTGCAHVLDDWIRFTDVYEPRTSVGCQKSQYQNFGGLSPQWAKDPCCNHGKRKEIGCAPRTEMVKRRAIDTIDYDSVGLYQ